MSINDGLSTHTLAMVVISTHNTEAMVFTLKVVDSTAVGLIGISHPSRGNARRNAIGMIKFTVWCSVQILRRVIHAHTWHCGVILGRLHRY